MYLIRSDGQSSPGAYKLVSSLWLLVLEAPLMSFRPLSMVEMVCGCGHGGNDPLFLVMFPCH